MRSKILLSIITLALINSTCYAGKKDPLKHCIDKVNKEEAKCLKDNEKKAKKGKKLQDCKGIANAGRILCNEEFKPTSGQDTTLPATPSTSSESGARVMYPETDSVHQSMTTDPRKLNIIWTRLDDENLKGTGITREDFTDEQTTYEECIKKIASFAASLKAANSPQAGDSKLFNTLKKICKLNAQKQELASTPSSSRTESTSSSTESFQTPSVFGSSSPYTSSPNGSSQNSSPRTIEGTSTTSRADLSGTSVSVFDNPGLIRIEHPTDLPAEPSAMSLEATPSTVDARMTNSFDNPGLIRIEHPADLPAEPSAMPLEATPSTVDARMTNSGDDIPPPPPDDTYPDDYGQG